MKVFLFGKGARLLQLVDAFSAKRQHMAVVTGHEPTFSQLADKKVTRVLANPATFDLSAFSLKPAPEDLVLLADHEETALRETLETLHAQKVGVPVVVFTDLATGQLARQFPDVEFKNDKRLYRSEVKQVLRKSQTVGRVAALRRLVQGRPVLVLTWGNPDPDAIGSAYALRELIGADARAFVTAYSGEFTRPENEAMVQVIGIPMQKFHAEMIADETVVATVDAQPSFFKNQEGLRFDVVIDHHPVGELGSHAFVDIRPDYGSTCSILTEYFQACRLKIHRKAATALFYGLKTDTNTLQRNVADADVAAFQLLRPLADENMLRTIELTQYPASVLDAFADAIRKRRLLGDVLFSYLGDQQNPDLCVQAADFLIRAQGVNWAVTAARSGGKLVVVFRCTGFRTHAGEVAESLFAEFGTAGGHRTMARAELDLSRIDSPDLERWLLARLGTKLRAVKEATAR
jgi:nanoRNase/pAp phosphatase (c-di-AMP/oligoRNAs hydrolase)